VVGNVGVTTRAGVSRAQRRIYFLGDDPTTDERAVVGQPSVELPRPLARGTSARHFRIAFARRATCVKTLEKDKVSAASKRFTTTSH